MKHQEDITKKPEWNRFYITYNPSFDEYHAIRELSGCSVFSSKKKSDVKKWIAEKGQPVQLDLFE